jgi:hypothetical protein
MSILVAYPVPRGLGLGTVAALSGNSSQKKHGLLVSRPATFSRRPAEPNCLHPSLSPTLSFRNDLDLLRQPKTETYGRYRMTGLMVTMVKCLPRRESAPGQRFLGIWFLHRSPTAFPLPSQRCPRRSPHQIIEHATCPAKPVMQFEVGVGGIAHAVTAPAVFVNQLAVFVFEMSKFSL